MGTEVEAADIFKCPVCNGNVRIGPDDMVITCSYCGSTTTIEGKAIGDHLMEMAIGDRERTDGFRAYLGKHKGANKALVQGAQVVENNLIFVPVWTSKVKADSWYKGYKTVQVPVQRTRTVRDAQGHTRTETYTEYETGYVPVQSEIHTDTDEPLLARKGSRFYGLEEYLKTVDLRDTDRYDFEKIKDLKPTMLNAEIGADEYEKSVTGRVADRHRAEAKHGLSELFDCRTTTSVRGTTYLQAPFALIRYKFGGGLFKCAMDGHTGKVLIGEIPITKGQRALWTILAFLGIIVAAVGGEFAYRGYISEPGSVMIGGIVAAVLGVIMTVLGIRILVMPQREEKG